MIFERTLKLWKAFIEFKDPSEATKARLNTPKKYGNNNIEVYESKLKEVKFNARNPYARGLLCNNILDYT